MTTRGLLDTSTLVRLGQIEDVERLPEEPLISTITLAERSVGPLVASTPAARAAPLSHLQQSEADFEAMPFDPAAAQAFGRVASSLRERGRKPAARAFDAQIAAVTVSRELPVHTCSPRDFAGIDDLIVHAVPHPDDRET